MKAVISNRIYLECDKERHKEIKKELTYSFPQYNPTAPHIIHNDVFRVNDNISTIPVGCKSYISGYSEIVDKRCKPDFCFPDLRGTLRNQQQEILDEVTDNCIINAKPGFGKTILALAIARKFGTTTLILTHTGILRDQWISEIDKFFGIKAGVIGGGRYDFDRPIVVGTVQSVVKILDKISDKFGLLVADESHKLPAKTFVTIFNRMKSRYKIGLTGTLERKDNKHVIIPDYISTKVIQPDENDNVLQPEVHIISTELSIPRRKRWSTSITELSRDEHYIDLLYAICKKYESEGHKILLVADRVELLETLYELLPTSTLITGTNTGLAKDRKEAIDLMSSTCNILLGSVSIFKEGISYNPLSCLVLGIQTNNLPMLEQTIGRIQRKHPNKKQPVIVDMFLKGLRQTSVRLDYYRKKGYKIDYI